MGNLHHPNLPFMARGGLCDLFFGDGCIFSVFLSFLTAWRMGCFLLSWVGV
jgi:hypothetical protein